MIKYVLILRHDNAISTRMRSQNWNLRDLITGFIIELRVQEGEGNQELRTTNRICEKLFYREDGRFLSYLDIEQSLRYILYRAQVPLDASDRFSCNNGLRLLLPNSTRSGPSSVSVYSLKNLVDRVFKHVRMIRNNPSILSQLEPIATDSAIFRFRPSQRVDESIIFDSESLRANTSNVVAPAVPARALVEEIIQPSCPEKECSICLEEFSVGQSANRMPCTHLFHKRCIACWLKRSPSCPLCRTSVADIVV